MKRVFGVFVGIFVLTTGMTGIAIADPVSADSKLARPQVGTVAYIGPRPEYVAYNYVTVDPTRIRVCQHLNCNISGYARPSEILVDSCYVAGDAVFGNPWWDSVRDTASGVSGFVSVYYLQWRGQADHC